MSTQFKQVPDFHSIAVKNIFKGDPEEFEGDMPKTKEKIKCSTHGLIDLQYFPKYESIRDRFDGKPAVSHSFSRYCKTCLDDEIARLKIEHKNYELKLLDEAINKKFLQNLESRGVSVRNSGVRLDDVTPRNEKQSEALASMITMRELIKSGGSAGNLILIGSVGTGKTMLTSGMVCDLVVAKKSPATARVIDIIRSMKDTWKKDCQQTETQLIAEYVNLDLLIIDEIGVQFGSDTEKMFIFDIIDGRYNKMKPTILISNLTMQGIKECIGDRCVDRLREDGGKVIAFDFESQRGKS